MVLEFELKASHLPGKCSSTSFFFFLLVRFFKIGSCELFAQGWLQITILLIFATWVARITGVSHQCLAAVLGFQLRTLWVSTLSFKSQPHSFFAFFVFQIKSWATFTGLAWTMIFLISASLVAGIIGLYHHTWPWEDVFWTQRNFAWVFLLALFSFTCFFYLVAFSAGSEPTFTNNIRESQGVVLCYLGAGCNPLPGLHTLDWYCLWDLLRQMGHYHVLCKQKPKRHF
jgi:hypothetical protein